MDYYKSIMWKEIEQLDKSYNNILSEINSMKVPYQNEIESMNNMAQYISKTAVVAEIERRLDENKKEYYLSGDTYASVLKGEEEDILSFINTLEMKEVDLEDTKKEEFAQKYIDYIFKRHNIDPESKEGQLIYYAYMHGMNQCLNQLKSQKGE